MGDDTKKLEKIKLQLQWKHQFEFAGFYAAKEKGFYKDVGLDVEFVEYEKNMNITREVLRRNTEYGLNHSSLIADYIEGKPIVMIANFFKNSPLVLVTHKDIQTPANLNGKRVMGLGAFGNHNITIFTMLSKFGINKTDIQNIPTTFNLDDFIAGKVDAITVFTTNEIYTLNQKGVEFNIFDPVSYGTKFYDQNLFTTKTELTQHPQRVENFRKASIRGWKYALQHKKEMVDIIFKKYNPQAKTKEALMFEARQIESLILPDIHEIGSIDPQIIKMMADSFIQSGYVSKRFNTDYDGLIYLKIPNSLELTPEQKGYLERKKEIRMCVDPNWMPLEKIENGNYIGIGSDYIKLISQKIGIPIRLIKTTTWSETLEKGIQRECDILAMAEKIPIREKNFDFTAPYIKTPIVIATKAGRPFMDDMEGIKHKKLGVVKNYSSEELLRNKYPGINLIEVESIQEGLAQVQQEKLFGFLDNSIVINHEIQRNNLKDLAVSGQFRDTISLGIASRSDEPLLHEILDEALLTIDDKTRNEIINRWVNIRYELQTDYRLVWEMMFFALIIIAVIMYWNFKLKEEIRKKEKIKVELKASEEKFRTLFDMAPILMDAFDSKGKVILWNKECEKVFGWSYDEIKDEENPIALFYPDPKDQQKLLNSLNNRTYNVYEEWSTKTKSGVTVITMWANIYLPNGEVIHVGYDVTQQRKDERAIREKTEKLKTAKQQLKALNNTLEKRIRDEIDKNVKQQFIMMQQKRLVQMGEMIGNIAHQWRQPLAQVNSSVLLIDAILAQHCFDNPAVEEKLSEIESLTEYMSKTIDNFKNFFNPDKQKKIFCLRHVVEQALSILQGSLSAHYIRVEININETHEWLGFFEELQQVVMVIVNNAIDAIVSCHIQGAYITINVSKKEDIYTLSICDNAGGVPPEIQEKIFEPYFTTKHKSQGTGLGLYMAKMIVEEGLGGRLNICKTDEGACFEIILSVGEN